MEKRKYKHIGEVREGDLIVLDDLDLLPSPTPCALSGKVDELAFEGFYIQLEDLPWQSKGSGHNIWIHDINSVSFIDRSKAPVKEEA
jgi:hypothetical protein